MHLKMVENGTFWVRMSIFCHLENANKWGYKMLCILKLGLHLQFLQYYIVHVVALENVVKQNISSYGQIWDPKNIQKTFILRKLDPLSAKSFTGYISIATRLIQYLVKVQIFHKFHID